MAALIAGGAADRTRRPAEHGDGLEEQRATGSHRTAQDGPGAFWYW